MKSSLYFYLFSWALFVVSQVFATSYVVHQGEVICDQEEQTFELLADDPFTVLELFPQDGFAELPLRFIEFHLDPLISEQANPLENIDFAGSILAFSEAGEKIFVTIPQPSGEWITFEKYSFPRDEALHILIRQSFAQASTWDLIINGQLVAFDLPILPSQTEENGFFAISSSEKTTVISNPLFSSENPLFADQDKDLIPDSYELGFGLNPWLNDRQTDLDQDGRTALQEYQDGTAADLNDYQAFADKEILYIDNRNGDDQNNGKSAIKTNRSGPLFSFEQASQLAPPGSTIVLLNGTGLYDIPNLYTNGKQLRILSQNNLKIR